MSDEILIRRTQNGWILTQYTHDDEQAYGPLTTVHEDSIAYHNEHLNEAESLADLLREAFPFHMRTKDQSGIEITIHPDRPTEVELPAAISIPASPRWPTLRYSNSGTACDACGEQKEVVEIIQTDDRSSFSVCEDCKRVSY
jgi:hypothetical protein